MNKINNEHYQLLIWLLLLFIILIFIYFIIHPIIITLFLVIYTILISINISLWKTNYIFSIILFLIIIRGLMIIFIYFSSLISNEKTIFINLNLLASILLFIIILALSIKFSCSYLLKFTYIETNPLTKLNFKLFNNILSLYIYPNNYITLLRILFLLLCFFLIVKICSFRSLPMRKLTYDKIQ